MFDVVGAIPEMRGMAESLMLDAGEALRPLVGRWEVVDGIEVPAIEMLFQSQCKIQTRQVQAQESQVGGRTAVEVRMELHLPADTEPLAVGDLWEITNPHELSFAVEGDRYRITAPVDGSLKTARRYQIEREAS